MNCPKCNTPISIENINIQENIAKCTSCQNIFKASEGLDTSDSKFNMNQPPSGAWYEQTPSETIIGATTRSAMALFLIPFVCVWSGLSIGSIYGSQIANQEFSLFESLLGLPFLIGTLFLLKMVLMSIFGKVEIHTNRQGGTIFTGIGAIGKKQTFLWREVSKIDNGISRPWFQRNDQEAIVIEGATSLIFGVDLNQERRYYILSALKKMKSQYRG